MHCIDSSFWRRLAVWTAVALVALALRALQLERRPAHNDEANQAWKAGLLLDTGVYRYDPHEHHGPTLYYLSLPLAWLQSGGSFAATRLWVYRLLPALFGAILALLALTAGSALGRGGAAAGAVLTALSPALVYYSRFFIQEMLLATFTFALLLALWRYAVQPSRGWAALVGICLGLMHSTKETWVLAAAALALALTVGLGPRRVAALARERWRDALLALACAAAVAVPLYSSFFTWSQGPLDSLLAYTTYLDRGTAGSAAHRHPFGWYAGLLVCRHPFGRLCWGEELIALLALWGASVCWTRPGLTGGQPVALRVLCLYAAILTLAYSLLPYKTPWCLVSFWHAWTLLAGVGAAALVTRLRRPGLRLAAVGILAVAALRLGNRAWLASTRYAADPRNPYAYAQTGSDFLRLVGRIEDLRECSPEGYGLPVYTVAPPDCTWPLPWYLRRYTQTGYWTALDPAVIAHPPAVLVTTPALAETLPAEWSTTYVQEYYGLRPEVLLAAFIRRDLWDRFLEERAKGALPRPGWDERSDHGQ